MGKLADAWKRAEHTVVLDKTTGNVGLTLTNTDDQNGCKVSALKPDGLAACNGIKVGDIIMRINEHNVGTHGEAVSLIDRASTTVRLIVLAGSRASSDNLSGLITS